MTGAAVGSVGVYFHSNDGRRGSSALSICYGTTGGELLYAVLGIGTLSAPGAGDLLIDDVGAVSGVRADVFGPAAGFCGGVPSVAGHDVGAIDLIGGDVDGLVFQLVV